jgi:hypothetical protein
MRPKAWFGQNIATANVGEPRTFGCLMRRRSTSNRDG